MQNVKVENVQNLQKMQNLKTTHVEHFQNFQKKRKTFIVHFASIPTQLQPLSAKSSQCQHQVSLSNASG